MTPSRTSKAGVGSTWAESLQPRSADLLARSLVVLIGLGVGSSVFLGFGFYDLAVWGWVALGALALLLGLWIADPALPRGAALAAAVGLLALWLWSLLSTRWAESADQALVDSDRWLLYATVLLTLLVLLRRRGLERLLLAAAIAPVAGLAAYLLARMALGDGGDLFLVNRLNEPLEYVNGLAAYLVIGFWPMIAVAERVASRLAAGAALATATLLAGLTVMTQSRGAIAALVLSAVVLIAVVPGRTKRGWALVAVVAGVGACSGGLGDVVATLPPGVGAPSDDVIADAARLLLFVSVAIGALWGVARPLWERRSGAGAGRGATVALVAVTVIGLVAASLPVSERTDQLSEQYNAFTELRADDDEGSRLVSGGGNRYDYWRVAVDQFDGAPIRGIGAGNYDTTYFQERRTAENIRNPHSIELQVLGETGVIGGAALALFIGGVLAGLVGRARSGWEGSDPGLAVAAGGAFLVWLGQTSVDWLHLIPGLSGIALCAAAALLVPSMREFRPEAFRLRASLAGVAVVVASAGLFVALPLLAGERVSSGRELLDSDPRGAVVRARDALSLNDESLAAYELEAAGLARLGDYAGARAALTEATEREPSDYVPWALLGDLTARRGDLAASQGYYARASELNPIEPALAELAASRAAIAELVRAGDDG